MNASSNIGIKLSLEGASQAEASLGRISQGVSKLGDAANSIRSAVGGLAGAFVGIGSAVQLVQAADAVTQLNNSLRLATGSAAAAGAAYEALFAIAQRSRSNFTELGNTFASITRATQALGVSQQQVLAITETIGNAITVSGASAQASEAALMQLGQGLASGALRGEELNSILEQTPRLAKALADGLGVPVGALKKLGEQGALTAEAVIQALQSQQKVLAAEVSQSVATVGQAYTVLKNSAVALVGTLDQATGTSAGLAQAIMSVGQSLGDIQSAFKGVNAEAVTFDPLADAIATSFEAISVLGVNVAFVVKSIGTELGGLAAQAVAVATGQFSQAAEIGRLMRADAEKARQEVDALSRRLVNARQLRELAESANKGLDFSAEDARLSRQAGNKVASPLDFSKLVDGAGSAKKALKEVDAALDASRDMAKRWADVIADANRIAAESNASSLELTKGQARLLEYLGSPEYQGMDEPARQLALQQLYAAIATEQNTAAQRKLADMLVESQKAHAKSIELLERNASAAAEQVARLELEAVATDLAATSQTSLAVAIEQVTIARLKEQQAAMMADEAAVLAIQKEIDAREKLVKLITSKEVRDASTKAAEDAKREWDKSFEQVQQSLTDALMAGGKSGYEYIKGLFRTLVLRPTIQAVVNPVAGAITGSMGLAGNANAAGGIANGASTWGTIGSTIGALGTGFGAGASMIAGGGIGGWLSASTSLIGTGTAAGAMAGIGALAGPIAPVLAIGALLKSLDDSGTMHTGGLGAYSAAGGASTGNAVKSANAGFFNLAPADYQASTEQASVAMAKSVVGLLDSTANTFGQKAGYYAATAFADDTSDDGAWGALMVKLGDQMLIDWKNGTDKWPGREFADGEAGAKEYAAAVAKDVRDYLITQTPDWADQALKALGDAPSIEQLADTVTQINRAAYVMDAAGASAGHLAPWMERIAGSGPLTAEALRQIAEFPSILLQQAGTSRDALVQAYATGLMTGDANAAGQSVADQLVASIEQSLVGNGAAQIFDIVNAGIVTPMLDAILAGQLATEAISQQAIDAVVAKATAAAEALGQVLNDAGFQDAIARLRDTVSSALGAAGSTISYKPRYQPSDVAAQEAAAREREQARLQAERDAQAAAEAAARAAQQAAEEAARAAAEYQQALADAQGYINGIARTISDFLAGLDAQAGGLQSYTRAAAAFSAQMVLAQGGDRDALANITGSASALVDAIRRESNSAAEASLRIGRVRGQLDALPSRLSPEQFIVDGVSSALGTSTSSTVSAIGTGALNTIAAVNVSGTAIAAAMALNASQVSAAVNTGFASWDANSDGLLTIDEFRAGMAGKASDAELGYWFDRLDRNGDGTISQLELIAARTGTVAFDANDPMRSVWEAIRAGTATSAFYLQDASNKLNAIQYYLGEPFRGTGSLKIRGETTAFAKGGVFTNSVVSSATPFNMGLMGEAGPEAIMPLTRGPDGRLGVVAQVQMPDWSQYGRFDGGSMQTLVSEIRALREENQAQARAVVQLQQRLLRLNERWDANGLPETRVVA